MPNDGTCNTCRYAQRLNDSGNHSVVNCIRYPQNVTKSRDDMCGEYSFGSPQRTGHDDAKHAHTKEPHHDQ
jgi:hypothetical protein